MSLRPSYLAGGLELRVLLLGEQPTARRFDGILSHRIEVLSTPPALLIVVVGLTRGGRRSNHLGPMKPPRRLVLSSELPVKLAQAARAQRCVRGQTREVTKLIGIDLMCPHSVVGQGPKSLSAAPRTPLHLDAGAHLGGIDDALCEISFCHYERPASTSAGQINDEP